MAAADYRLCDKCWSKTFYDTELSYEFKKDNYTTYETPVRGCDYWLGHLGDWKCLCRKCAETHKVIIVEA